MSDPMTKYVKFVPDNLQEELNFMGVMFESGVINRDNFVRMQGMLEIAGHLPNDDPMNYDTGNDFLFSICGKKTINKFIKLMEEKMPDSKYKISDVPIGRLIDKEERIKKIEEKYNKDEEKQVEEKVEENKYAENMKDNGSGMTFVIPS